MSSATSVTIGVPVYRGELFIEETLRSIQSQTHRDVQVIISLDGPEPASEELCRPFLKDARFRLVIQPQRLGWVGNINWLMSQVETSYWYYHQQDDLVDPRYVEVLLDHATRTPEAAVVYCDIVAFGLQNWKLAQPSVTGSASARQLTLLYEHLGAVAFRGLTRVEALRHSGGVPTNEVENFSADTAWMAAIARWGELHRVPLELYRKRYHTDNTHVKWKTWPADKRARAWTVHCADMLEQAMLVDGTVQERRLLWLATIARLASSRTACAYLPVASLQSAERVTLLDAFVEHVRGTRATNIPELLEADWREIRRWTRGFYWLPSKKLGWAAQAARAAKLVSWSFWKRKLKL
jgi:hypothetical protein